MHSAFALLPLSWRFDFPVSEHAGNLPVHIGFFAFARAGAIISSRHQEAQLAIRKGWSELDDLRRDDILFDERVLVDPFRKLFS